MQYVYTIYPFFDKDILLDNVSTFCCEADNILEADKKFKEFCNNSDHMFCGYGSANFKQIPWNVTTWSPQWWGVK